jgi:UDP-glucose 4-epimerase
MSQYLITGGAGFIGSALAHKLIKAGHEIVIMDNLSTGKLENLPSQAKFFECDLSDPASLDLLPNAAFDGVAHLAAQSSGEIGQNFPYNDMQVNVGSTLLISRWCVEKNIKRLIFTSSMTVYGSRNINPVDENEPCEPIGYYGVSKITSEHYLRIASREGLSTTALRLYNVYGPNQNMNNIKQGMVSIYLAYLLSGLKVPVTGALDRFRDFVFIDDVVSALEATLICPSTPSPAYNIGSGRKTTVQRLLTTLISSMELTPEYPIEELAGSANDVFGSIADISRAKSELDWKPQVSLEEGLAKMVAWAKQQPKPIFS